MAVRVPSGRHVVALSGGTTTAEVARELAWRQDLTVVTNALTIATLLSERRRVRVVMTGGFLRPESLELVGALAENTFTAVNVGTAILGVDGVSAAAGVTTHDETEARTNHAMVTKAQRTVVVADGSKVGPRRPGPDGRSRPGHDADHRRLRRPRGARPHPRGRRRGGRRPSRVVRPGPW